MFLLLFWGLCLYMHRFVCNSWCIHMYQYRCWIKIIIKFLVYVCMVNTIYLLSFVETPRKFIIAELSIPKLGSSSVPKSRYYKERQVDRKKRKAIRWWFVSIRDGRHVLSQCPKQRHSPINLYNTGSRIQN